MRAPVPPLEKAWEFKVDSSIKEPGLIAAGDMIFFASKDGRIIALEAASGQVKWTFRMGKAIKLPLVTTDETIIAASEDKSVYAIDAQTGQKRWQFSTGKDFRKWMYPEGYFGPLVVKGMVYVATKDKKLHALDIQTGKERWQFSAGGDISPPAVSREAIFFGSKDKRVYALEVDSGKKIWEAKTGHKKHSSSIIADGKVLIAEDDDLYALSPDNGTIMWKVEKALHWQMLPAVAGGLAFCTKDLAVIDLASGKEIERIPSLNDFRTVLVVDETLYAMALPKQTIPPHTAVFLFAYDVATRKEKWHACFDNLVSHIEVGGDSVLVPLDVDDKLIAINISKFTKRWESDKLPKGTFESFNKPLIAYGMVFLSCGKTIYAFRSSKDPASQRSLIIKGEISSSPKYKVETLRDSIIWPDCCCLCCGAVEEHVDLHVEPKIMGYELQVQAKGIPYCKECHKKINKMIGGEKPGVELTGFPPTYAFRNEKYWAMFMEANRLR
jgi:outer membrane protein assembly factor BamB